MATKHTGKCACGAIKYEFEGEPAAKALCHCLECQHRTGSAYTTNLLVPRPAFHITAGTLKNWTFKQSETGLQFKTAFCGDCGTLITKENDEADDFKPIYILACGTMDEGIDACGEPGVEFFVPHRAGWLPELKAAQLQGFS